MVLPPKGDAKPIPKKNIAELLINDAGEVMLDEQPVDVKSIREIIKRRLAENDKLTVSIKTNKQTRYQDFMSVLDQVQMAEARRISIANPDDT